MQTSEFNAMLRQWENRQLDRYLGDLDDDDKPAIPEECEGCNNHQCFKCGYGYGG
jgi:hypothetical protein